MIQQRQLPKQSFAGQINVLAISGSLRRDSYNRKALHVAKRFAVEAGANVEEVDLKELNLPMYDGDLEAEGFPESVKQLKDAVEQADVLLIASPEYNHSISAALKNAIDWLSRGKNSLDGRVAAIFGVSMGLLGTARAQFHLRQILEALNVFMVPQPQVLIYSAREVFNPDGTLENQKIEESLKTLVQKTIHLTRALKD